MKGNNIENLIIENEEDIRKFGKKKNNKNINYYFIAFISIIFIIILIYYFINIKKRNYSNISSNKDKMVTITDNDNIEISNLRNKFSDEFIFIHISDKNNIFNISFKNYDDYIKINAKYNKIISEDEYEKKIYLNELKFNSLWNTIDKAYKQIIYEIKYKDTKKIIIEKKYYINIIIPVDYLNFKQINLTIPKKIKSDNETIYNLINELKNLDEKIYKLKHKLNEKTKLFFNNSLIIKNDFNKQKKLIEWIEEKLNKNIILELIFKMTENGFTSKDFHNYCDNKGATLILIKTSNDEIIGGFTPLNWESPIERENKYDESGSTFLFSLTLNQKFDIIKKYYTSAIINKASFGPIFGVGDLYLMNNLKEGKSVVDRGCNFFYEGKVELVEEKGNTVYIGYPRDSQGLTALFEVSELEVYKVIY